MSSVAISVVTFAVVFCGALFGVFLRPVLPQHHLSADSKDVVKLGMGLVGTMCALVLGLLVASAKELLRRPGKRLDADIGKDHPAGSSSCALWS